MNIRFQNTPPPTTVFADRGNGFYESFSGRMTDGYRAALRAQRLKAFFPENASIQPGQLQEFMLHETAVAWMRTRLTKTLPKDPWKETVDEYHTRLRACAAHINDHHDVEGLCNELPYRVGLLQASRGDRINK